MTQLVNYKKRGVELPKGCKDLIDILQGPRRAKAPLAAVGQPVVGGVKFERFSTHGLAQIERYVNRLLESKSKVAGFSIVPSDQQTETCCLFHMEGGLHLVLFVNEHDTERERTVRALFESLGIQPTLNYVMIYPKIRLLRYPLPSDAPSVAHIVADLLVKGFGLREDAGLDLFYMETRQPLNCESRHGLSRPLMA